MFTNHILALTMLGVILSAIALISNLARRSYEAGPSVAQSVISITLITVFMAIAWILTMQSSVANHSYSFETLPDTVTVKPEPIYYDSGWINEQWMREHNGIKPTKAEIDSLHHIMPINHEEDDWILIPLSDPEQVEANEIEQSLYNQELNRLKPISVNVSL